MIWDTATRGEWRTLRDLTGGINRVAWSPDGRQLACTDATVKIGDPATGKILRTLRGHTGWVEGVAFSPDGQWIASASLDRTVKLWPAQTPRSQRTRTNERAITIAREGSAHVSNSLRGLPLAAASLYADRAAGSRRAVKRR